MGRYVFTAFTKARTARWIVVWDLHWHVLETQCLQPPSDLSAAMAGTIERLEREGWRVEGTPEYGFTFIRRESERRLLMLTPRNPFETTTQSFDPFRR